MFDSKRLQQRGIRSKQVRANRMCELVLKHLCVCVGERLNTDSEAAKSFVSRRGLGRMRHIEVRELWLQEEVRKGKVVVEKVQGSENPADLMTKFLSKVDVADRLCRMGITWKERHGTLKKGVAWADQMA